jgi:aspartyl protease family protein
MKTAPGILLALLLIFSTPAAATDIVVLGLFRDMAILQVDGEQHRLQVGDSTPQGIRLIAADSHEAILEIDGKQETWPLGSVISTEFIRPEMARATVYRRNEMYYGAGSINGQPVDFIVDTGASFIAMNALHARRLGIDFRVNGHPVQIQTASGVEQWFKVKLERVKVGDIELRQVDGVVSPGSAPAIILLGMSFLNQLDMQREGDKLVLQRKW